MDPNTLNGWVTVASVLIGMGIQTANGLKLIFASGGLTPDEQNQVLDALKDDNARRRAISAAIAAGL